MTNFVVRRTSLAIILVVFLASIYMLTYSGRIESGNSLALFDATSSLAQFGDTLLDQSLWFNLPDLYDLQHPLPLRELQVESLSPTLQPILALPLYQLAYKLSGVGLVHTVWVFNIVVTAAAGGLLFFYVLALEYREKTAIVATLVFGLATIAFPYSKTFFREPLTLFLVLLAGLLIKRLVTLRYRSVWLWLGISLTMIGILMTKTAAVFAFPALVAAALPQMTNHFRRRSMGLVPDLALIALLITPCLAIYSGILGGNPTYEFSFIGRLNVSPFYMRTALHSYLLSIGGSVWATSPVVLLAIPGGWWLYRQRQRRYVWVAALITLGYAFGYALLSNKHWFGGLSWPPRFLTPIVPFLILLTLPVLDHVLRQDTSRRWKLLVGVILAYSLWVQFCAVTLEWGKYPDALPPEAGHLIEWSPGLNTLQYLRWLVIPGLWGRESLDFAWVRAGSPGWALSFASLAVVGLSLLWYESRKRDIATQMYWGSALLPVLFVILTGVGLHTIVSDPVYQGANPALRDLMPILAAETTDQDIVLLSDNTYERFFLNYARLDARVITLPVQPGERPSEAQLPDVVSDNPDVLLTNITPPVIYQLAEKHDRLWLLENSGAFIPWSVRPIERFMTMHYYPIREIQTVPPDPTVRLLEYSTVRAPDPYAFRAADNLTTLIYGEAIQLLGYTLPSGTTYRAGGVLPISLYWQTSESLKTDYTVAWFLVNADTNEVALQGWDSQPSGGFAPTSTWHPGTPLWDNRAMRLPPDLSPGTYRLWVSLYGSAPDGGIHRLPVSEETVTQATGIGILPTVIQVTSLTG